MAIQPPFFSAPRAGLARTDRWLLSVAALTLLLSPRAFSSDAAPRSLRDVLTPAEFERAGLQKLSPEELAFLSKRLLGGTDDGTAGSAEPNEAPTAPVTAAAVTEPALEREKALADSENRSAAEPELSGESAFGREQELRDRVEETHKIPRVMLSQITGQFRGWSGHTIFKLDNGQTWRQIDNGEFSVNLMNPKVSIRRGAFGSHFLRVEGYGARVRVERIE